jgi:hypothetical protein
MFMSASSSSEGFRHSMGSETTTTTSSSEISHRSTESEPMFRNSSNVQMKTIKPRRSHLSDLRVRKKAMSSLQKSKAKSRPSPDQSPPEILAFGAVLDHLVKGGNLTDANKVFKEEFQLISNQDGTTSVVSTQLGNIKAPVCLTAEQQLAKQHLKQRLREPDTEDDDEGFLSSFSARDDSETIYEDESRFMEESRCTEEHDSRYLENDTRMEDDDEEEVNEDDDDDDEDIEDEDNEDKDNNAEHVADQSNHMEKDDCVGDREQTGISTQVQSALTDKFTEETDVLDEKIIVEAVSEYTDEYTPRYNAILEPFLKNTEGGVESESPLELNATQNVFPLRASNLREHYSASRTRSQHKHSDKEESFFDIGKNTKAQEIDGKDRVQTSGTSPSERYPKTEAMVVYQGPTNSAVNSEAKALDLEKTVSEILKALSDIEDSKPEGQERDLAVGVLSSPSVPTPFFLLENAISMRKTLIDSSMMKTEGSPSDTIEDNPSSVGAEGKHGSNGDNKSESQSTNCAATSPWCNNAELCNIRRPTGESLMPASYTSFVKMEDGTLAVIEEKVKNKKFRSFCSFFKTMKEKNTKDVEDTEGSTLEDSNENQVSACFEQSTVKPLEDDASICVAIQNAVEETLGQCASPKSLWNSPADLCFRKREAWTNGETLPATGELEEVAQHEAEQKTEAQLCSKQGDGDIPAESAKLVDADSFLDDKGERLAKTDALALSEEDTLAVNSKSAFRKARNLPFLMKSLSFKNFSSKRRSTSRSFPSLVCSSASTIASTLSTVDARPNVPMEACGPEVPPEIDSLETPQPSLDTKCTTPNVVPSRQHTESGLNERLETKLDVSSDIELFGTALEEPDLKSKGFERTDFVQNVHSEEPHELDTNKMNMNSRPPFSRVDTFQNIGQELLYVESGEATSKPRLWSRKSKSPNESPKDLNDSDKIETNIASIDESKKAINEIIREESSLEAKKKDAIIWGPFLGMNIKRKRKPLKAAMEAIPESQVIEQKVGKIEVREPQDLENESTQSYEDIAKANESADVSVTKENVDKPKSTFEDGIASIFVECAKVRSELQVCSTLGLGTMLEFFINNKRSKDGSTTPIDEMTDAEPTREPVNCGTNIWESLCSFDPFNTNTRAIESTICKENNSTVGEVKSKKATDHSSNLSDSDKSFSFNEHKRTQSLRLTKPSTGFAVESRQDRTEPVRSSARASSNEQVRDAAPDVSMDQNSNSYEFGKERVRSMPVMTTIQSKHQGDETTTQPISCATQAKPKKVSFWNRKGGVMSLDKQTNQTCETTAVVKSKQRYQLSTSTTSQIKQRLRMREI